MLVSEVHLCASPGYPSITRFSIAACVAPLLLAAVAVAPPADCQTSSLTGCAFVPYGGAAAVAEHLAGRHIAFVGDATTRAIALDLASSLAAGAQLPLQLPTARGDSLGVEQWLLAPGDAATMLTFVPTTPHPASPHLGPSPAVAIVSPPVDELVISFPHDWPSPLWHKAGLCGGVCCGARGVLADAAAHLLAGRHTQRPPILVGHCPYDGIYNVTTDPGACVAKAALSLGWRYVHIGALHAGGAGDVWSAALRLQAVLRLLVGGLSRAKLDAILRSDVLADGSPGTGCAYDANGGQYVRLGSTYLLYVHRRSPTVFLSARSVSPLPPLTCSH